MVGQIYPTELQLNKANSSDTEAPFFRLKRVKEMVTFTIRFVWFCNIKDICY